MKNPDVNTICQALVLSHVVNDIKEAEEKCINVLMSHFNDYEEFRKNRAKKPIIETYSEFVNELNQKLSKPNIPTGTMLYNLFLMWDKQIVDEHAVKTWGTAYQEIKSLVPEDIDMPNPNNGVIALKDLYDTFYPPQPKLFDFIKQ